MKRKDKILNLIQEEYKKHKEFESILSLDLSPRQKEDRIQKYLKSCFTANNIYCVDTKVSSVLKNINFHYVNYIEKLSSTSNLKHMMSSQLHNSNHYLPLAALHVICALFSAARRRNENTNNAVTATNVKMVLQRNYFESLVITSFSVYCSKNHAHLKKWYNELSVRERLSLGQLLLTPFIIEGLLKIEPFQKGTRIKEYINLTDKGSDLLKHVSFFKYNLPKLYPNNLDEYIKNEEITKVEDKYFSVEDIDHSLYHINDSTNKRLDSSLISKNCLISIDYLQNTEFIINGEVLDSVMNNIEAEYLEVCDGDTIAVDFDTEKEYITSKNVYGLIDLKKIRAEYTKSKDKLDKFLETITAAKLFKNYTFFFNVFLDWRGRYYYQGYPLNPQGDTLSRKLLLLKSSEEICGNDVTASGFQMMGLLTGCKETLTMTRLFKPKEGESFEDIYNFNMNKVLEKLKDLNFPYNNIFTRSFFKDLIMCRIYSESSFTRSKKIINEVASVCKAEIKFEEAYKIAKLIEDCLQDNNSTIMALEEYLHEASKKIIDRGDDIKLKTGINHILTLMVYPAQEVKRISVKNFANNENTQITLKVNKYPYKASRSKIKNSIIPNLIHQIDSLVLYKVVEECKEQGIHLFVVHDSVYVDISNVRALDNIYYQTCKKIFADKYETFPLKIFLEENSLLKDEYFSDFSKNSFEKIKTLFQELEKNDKILK